MRGRQALAATGFLLLVLGAKLFWIGEMGVRVPDWDHWGQEGEKVLLPWLQGRFGAAELFTFAGVHQRPMSRLFALGLVQANHDQWDPMVQQVVGAALHAGVMALCALAVARRFGSGALAVSFAVLGACLVFPYGWRNTLWGFQSHFYLLTGFSVLAITQLVGAPRGEVRRAVGVGAGFLAVFTAGSGFVAGAAAAGVTGLQAALGGIPWRRALPTILAGVALIALGAWLIAEGAARDATGDNNFRQLRDEAAGAGTQLLATARAIGNVAGWPLPSAGLAGWLLYAPLFVFSWRWLRGRTPGVASGDAERAAAEAMLVALGAWALVQAAGLSALRSGVVAARHRDIVAVGPWLNALALWVLVRSAWTPARRDLTGRLPLAAAAAWVLCVVVGLGQTAWTVLDRELPRWQDEAASRFESLQLFLATDDPAHFEERAKRSRPHPRPELLVRLLREPELRNLLPSIVRDPLPLVPGDDVATAFTEGGVEPEGAPAPAPGRSVLGSWRAPGATSRGAARWQSAPLRTGAAALELDVRGAPEGAGPHRLRLLDAASGEPVRELALAPLDPARWRTLRVGAPDGAFRLEAVAPGDPEAGWLAFSAPREVGALSYLLVPLTQRGAAGAIAAAGALLMALAWIDSRAARRIA